MLPSQLEKYDLIHKISAVIDKLEFVCTQYDV